MIVVPIIPWSRKSKGMRQVKCSNTEIISIEFGIICKISFDDFCERYYKTDDLLTYVAQEKYIPMESFGFKVLIKMDGDEYNGLKMRYKKPEFDNYLIELAKQKEQYYKNVKYILSKQNPLRKYEITHWVEDFPKTEDVHAEWTEYVEVY